MSITISWDDQSGKDIDGIEIYRSNNPVDPENPGIPLVTLDPTATSYNDASVKNNNVYHYAVAAKKGAVRSVGNNRTVGYFSETGPGNPDIIRGDWVTGGYMGTVSPGDLITGAQLISMLPSFQRSSDTEPTLWYKFAFRGKILYYPSSVLFASSWNAMYNAGLIFGVDGPGATPDTLPGNVNQKVIVTIGGLQYLVRFPRISDIPYTQYLTDVADTAGSEYRSTYCRLVGSANESPTGQLPRLGSLSTIKGCMSAHSYSNGNAAEATYVPPFGTPISAPKATMGYWVTLVLELIMP